MISNYFKWITYFFLELVSSLLNFIFSIFTVNSALSFGVAFMSWLEIIRINKEIDRRSNTRGQMEQEALVKMEESKKGAKELEQELQG